MSSLITSPGSSNPLSTANQLKKLGGSSSALLLPTPSASANGLVVKSYSATDITATSNPSCAHLPFSPDYLCACDSSLPRTFHNHFFGQYFILEKGVHTKMLWQANKTSQHHGSPSTYLQRRFCSQNLDLQTLRLSSYSDIGEQFHLPHSASLQIGYY